MLLALILAISVFRLAAAALFENGDPLRAAKLAPGNARAEVAAARARVEDGEDPTAPAVRNGVQAALLRDVTITGGIELRALEYERAGDVGRTARLFELSSAISRRSLPTRLWLIQRSVDRGDVEGALGNFDLALRTSTAAPPILFPVLAGAASDPGLVQPIARLLDRPSDWRAAFFSYAIREGGDPASIATVLLEMRDRAAIAAAQADQMLVGQLIEDGRFATARRIHATFGRAKARGALIIDEAFSDPASAYPFGWGLVESAETGAARSDVGGRFALAYRSLPGAEGPVATQLLMLEPGAYRLVTANAAAPADPSAAPLWTVTCATGRGGQIALLPLPPRTDRSAAVDFTVSEGCAAQWLALNMRWSDRPSGQSGAVRSVSVQRR